MRVCVCVYEVYTLTGSGNFQRKLVVPSAAPIDGTKSYIYSSKWMIQQTLTHLLYEELILMDCRYGPYIKPSRYYFITNSIILLHQFE
jgi:hypothetical protein